MKKTDGKKAEKLIIRILSSSAWTKIENVRMATHEEDMMGIDMHYEWMGIPTQVQVKNMSWWKDMHSRRDTYFKLLELGYTNPEYNNIRIIIYGFAGAREYKGKKYSASVNIYYIKKLEEVWDDYMEKAYRIKYLGEKND